MWLERDRLPSSMLGFFQRQVAANPHLVAVRTRTAEMTYADLDQRSSSLAARLRSRVSAREPVVGLLADRGCDFVVGLLATWKAGCAYMPIEPGLPASRVEHMIRWAQCEVVLCDADCEGKVPAGVQRVELRDTASAEACAGVDLPAAGLAYVMFTSGTTGQPKAVGVEHRALVNRIAWMQREFPLGPGDCVLQKTPVGFDVSVWELCLWTISGASVWPLPVGAEKDPAAILDAIENAGVSVVHFVPSMLRAFCDHLSVARSRRLAGLRYVFCSGERLLASDYRELVSYLDPNADTRVVNLYGPTEATIDVSCYELREPLDDHVPIGKAIDNIELYVLGADGERLPDGEIGELAIAGVGLARGYLGDADLTTERFARCAFAPNQRVYLTGDLARVLPDGNLAFLGRRDDQVKIGGVRIQLSEIESCLHASGLASQATVVVREVANTQTLVAYVVPDRRRANVVRELCRIGAEGVGGSQPIELANGKTFLCRNKSDAEYMGHEVFEDSIYLESLRQLPQRPCIFDVGANVGMFSVLMSEVCDAPVLYSFEPVPETFELLQHNLSLYGIAGKCLNIGLSDRAGEASMSYYPNVASMSSYFADDAEEAAAMSGYLARRNDRNPVAAGLSACEVGRLIDSRLQKREIKTALKTLSQVIAEQGVQRIDLLKIDVEKAELNVLRGIGDADWAKIDQIVLEVHDLDGRLAAIKSLLDAKGFAATVEQEEELEQTCIYSVSAHRVGARGLEPRFVLRPPASPPIYQSRSRYLAALREHLLLELPGYMVPSKIVVLDEMPVTRSGKVDVAALPVANVLAPKEEPADEVELGLREIWAELLGRPAESISATDNFFEIGGHSLTATAMISAITRKFATEVSLDLLFGRPTIRAVAESIKGKE